MVDYANIFSTNPLGKAKTVRHTGKDSVCANRWMIM